ncbi:MAG: hypothetical protein ACLVEX_12560 [Ruthenibacterium lactatiformans]
MVQLLKDGAVTQEYAYDAYGYINADEFGIQTPFYGYNGEEQNPFTRPAVSARGITPRRTAASITQGQLFRRADETRFHRTGALYAHNNPVRRLTAPTPAGIPAGTASKMALRTRSTPVKELGP